MINFALKKIAGVSEALNPLKKRLYSADTAPNGIYGLMRKKGVDNMDSFKDSHLSARLSSLCFRHEEMPECTLF